MARLPALSIAKLSVTFGGLALGLALTLTLFSEPAQAGRYSAIVTEADQGRVLHAENADARRYPASLTKIMTLYLIFDDLHQGRLKLRQPLRVSSRAANQPPSTIGLRAGQTITVEEAILAAVTKSANDATVVLAESTAGSEVNFAQRMTQRAAALGMSATRFRNATGLPHSGQYTTARDMAKLALAMLRDHPEQYRYFSTPDFEWQDRLHSNHNRLLRGYPGADGMKTGYIHASGFNLVASATRHGRRIIGVIFGGTSASARDRRMVRLLDQGFLKNFGGNDMAVADAKPNPLPPLIATAHAATPRNAAAPDVAPDAASLSSLAPTPVAADATSNLTARDSWSVQVGAFSKWSQAQNQANRAAQLMPNLLAGRDIAIVADTLRGKKIYKSQISGFNATTALNTCAALKAEKLPCVVVEPGNKDS